MIAGSKWSNRKTGNTLTVIEVTLSENYVYVIDQRGRKRNLLASSLRKNYIQIG